MSQNRQLALAAIEDASIVLPRTADTILDDLESFARLLEKWQRVQNLVSRETLGALWDRHIADSLQLLSHWQANTHRIVDLGSGGGFPAIPLAIALWGSPATFVMVESNSRKSSFLRTVIRELGLSASVVTGRAESNTAGTGPADLITSRAMAPLADLFGYMAPYWGPESRALLHKGRDYRGEMTAADSAWNYDVIHHPSVTADSGVILEITSLSAKTAHGTA